MFLCITDMFKGTIGSMKELGVTESYKLKRQVVLSASEASEMILRGMWPNVVTTYSILVLS
jgi:hypothetical protein